MAHGEPGAADRLMAFVYDQLKGLARASLARVKPGQTLQATALVHEAWLRLDGDAVAWESRAHFFGAAARAMRNILVDEARRKGRLKRGGGAAAEELRTELAIEGGPTVDVLALDEALRELEAAHERPAQVVMFRYFGGLGFADIAGLLGVSESTVRREWVFARTWLRRALRDRD